MMMMVQIMPMITMCRMMTLALRIDDDDLGADADADADYATAVMMIMMMMQVKTDDSCQHFVLTTVRAVDNATGVTARSPPRSLASVNPGGGGTGQARDRRAERAPVELAAAELLQARPL